MHASTATVTIKDDGVGISPEFLPHVFDGFQQDPRTLASTLSWPGTRPVDRQALRRTSRRDDPSRERRTRQRRDLHRDATSPTATAAVDGPTAEEVAAGALRAISVLLVEDDEDARTLLTQTLEYYGAHVLPVASASEAVHMLEQHHADVLLSDLRMPGEDGFALIHNLRSRR